MRRLLVLLLGAALLNGCATGRALQPSPAAGAARDAHHAAVLTEYVQSLPLGTMVKVERVSGGSVTGTLMKATDQFIVIQRRTRLPEPAEQIALAEIARVTPQSRSNIARAIGIGAAAGGAAALGVFLVILAIYAD